MPNTLSPQEIERFQADGFLSNLPAAYDATEIDKLTEGLVELQSLLRPGEDTRVIREWHESSRFLFDICMNPKILDVVQDVLAPDFYLWASNFFIKEPRTGSTVGWHQDAYYWPLSPHRSVTVWLAFSESSVANGAMTVIPGSHKAGLLRHARSEDTDSVLTLVCESDQFSEDTAVPVELAPGQFSVHDDKLIHGSPPNRVDGRRIGLTIRYSATEVKCDLSVNPHFKTYLCRGTDRYRHNPVGIVPEAPFARLDREHVSVEEAGEDAEKKLGLR